MAFEALSLKPLYQYQDCQVTEYYKYGGFDASFQYSRFFLLLESRLVRGDSYRAH